MSGVQRRDQAYKSATESHQYIDDNVVMPVEVNQGEWLQRENIPETSPRDQWLWRWGWAAEETMTGASEVGKPRKSDVKTSMKKFFPGVLFSA